MKAWMKILIGIAVGFAIGFACRLLGIPSPAPPAIEGALLVLAMTGGYLVTDRWLVRRAATTRHLCGGPDGRTRADDQRHRGD